MARVWWVQCKPFAPEERKTAACRQFQSECYETKTFGMGWRFEGISDLFPEGVEGYDASYIPDAFWDGIVDLIKNRTFSRCQILYWEMNPGDVVLTKLCEEYYYGIITEYAYILKDDERFTWKSHVWEWIPLGEGLKNLQPSVQGALASKYCRGTVVELTGLAACTMKIIAGVQENREPINVNNFWEVLAPDDLEDLMAFYMQKEYRDFRFVPSSCKKNTPEIEFIMCGNTEDCIITCQTKVNAKIDVSVYSSDEFYRKFMRIYLFSGAGYKNDNYYDERKIVIVSPEELYKVLKDEPYFTNKLRDYFEFE